MSRRAVLLLVWIVSTSWGADQNRVWQIGRLLSVYVASLDPYSSEDFQYTPQLVGPEQPGQPLPDPQSAPRVPRPLPHASIRFIIRSETGSYVAERTTILLSEPPAPHSPGGIDPASIAPWVKDLPWMIKFCVQGKTLYYVDAKGKQRKARICHPSR